MQISPLRRKEDAQGGRISPFRSPPLLKPRDSSQEKKTGTTPEPRILAKPQFEEIIMGRAPLYFRRKQELSPLLCTGEDVFKKSRNAGVIGSPFLRKTSTISRSQKTKKGKEDKSKGKMEALITFQGYRKLRRGSLHKSMAAIGSRIENTRQEVTRHLTE